MVPLLCLKMAVAGGGGYLSVVDVSVLYGVLFGDHVPERTRAVDDHYVLSGATYLVGQPAGRLLVEFVILGLVGYDASAELDQYHRGGLYRL